MSGEEGDVELGVKGGAERQISVCAAVRVLTAQAGAAPGGPLDDVQTASADWLPELLDGKLAGLQVSFYLDPALQGNPGLVRGGLMAIYGTVQESGATVTDILRLAHRLVDGLWINQGCLELRVTDPEAAGEYVALYLCSSELFNGGVVTGWSRVWELPAGARATE